MTSDWHPDWHPTPSNRLNMRIGAPRSRLQSRLHRFDSGGRLYKIAAPGGFRAALSEIVVPSWYQP